MRKFILQINLQYPDWFKKGMVFYFDDEQGDVYGGENGRINEFPLRQGLAGYLFLMRMEGDRYLKEVSERENK